MNLEFSGCARFESDLVIAGQSLFVAVRFQLVGVNMDFDALLDTAAQWTLLSAGLQAAAGEEMGRGDQVTRLGTKCGVIKGRLGRRQIRLIAEEGESLLLDVPVFVSPEWPGPSVLGWKGCLENVRFALDPKGGRFYFARA